MKKIPIVILLIVLAGSAFLFKNNIENFYTKLLLKLPEVEKGFNNLVVQEIKKAVFNPPPLRLDKQEEQSFLTRLGIIVFTNTERVKAGLLPLEENTELDASAYIKAKDMLDNQYFAHESLSSVGVADLSKRVGYSYILIGENLALGNFKDDQALVQGWMDSPGHRANMLNPNYKDIGVSVIRGIYEGSTTWFAVQHFGLPFSACSEPSQILKGQINLLENQLQEIQVNLDFLRVAIDGSNHNGPSRNQLIQQYNDLVYQYNIISSEAKNLLEQYNNQVSAFNSCAGL